MQIIVGHQKWPFVQIIVGQSSKYTTYTRQKNFPHLRNIFGWEKMLEQAHVF